MHGRIKIREDDLFEFAYLIQDSLDEPNFAVSVATMAKPLEHQACAVAEVEPDFRHFLEETYEPVSEVGIHGRVWMFGSDMKVRIGLLHLGEITRKLLMQVEYLPNSMLKNAGLISEFLKQTLSKPLYDGFCQKRLIGISVSKPTEPAGSKLLDMHAAKGEDIEMKRKDRIFQYMSALLIP